MKALLVLVALTFPRAQATPAVTRVDLAPRDEPPIEALGVGASTWGWSTEGDQQDAQLGATLACAGDVNGDGFSDVLIGASLLDGIWTDEGKVLLFLGSAGGLSDTPAWTAWGGQEGARFGSFVATAGDVNADWFSDVLVGSSGFDDDLTDEGAAFLYLGSPSGLAPGASWKSVGGQAGAQLGTAVATAGDVNADGYSDVLVGASGFDNGQADEGRALLYLGSALGLATSPSWSVEGEQVGAQLGAALATAGDVNGDGACDVVVAASLYDVGLSDAGRAWVYLGSPTGLAGTPAWSGDGEPGALFGSSVAPAGDVDGDGFADLLVGARSYANPSIGEGLAFLFLGSAAGLATTAAWTAEGDLFNANFGASVAPAGDVNGDGFGDVLVGAPQFADPLLAEGAVFLYLGSGAGLSATPAWRGEGEQVQCRYGHAVAAAGDVNGDGYGDFLVGASRFDAGESDEGRAFLYSGAAGGLPTDPAWVLEGEAFGSLLGTAVASARDVNGDGYGDVLVGAPGYRNGQTSEGRALLFLGSQTGLAPTPAWARESNRNFARFGATLSSAGDVNGDGYDDVLVGAPDYENGESDEGRAFLYLGSPTGLATVAAWTREGNQVQSSFGDALTSAGDVNGDGFGDVLIAATRHDGLAMDSGRVELFLGSPAGLGSAPAWTSAGDETQELLGFALASAGDVDGDGFGDFVVATPFWDGPMTDLGRVELHRGSPHGPSATADWVLEGTQGYGYFGFAVAGYDLDGDGFGDVIVSSGAGTGQVAAYLGSAMGLGDSPAWVVTGSQIQTGFGAALGVNDVDGDGYGDVLVGSNAYGNGGRVLLYPGSALGPATSSSWTFESNRIGAGLGRSVASAGDVNGDGYGDVIAGAAGYSNGDSNEGAAFLHLGNEGRGGWLRAVRQGRAGSAAPIALLGRAPERDGFHLRATLARSLAGFAWATPLPVRARLEWELEPSLGGSFDGLGIRAGMLTPLTSVPLELDELATDLEPGSPHRWRVRVRTGNPLLPATPWVSLPGNGRCEAKLRARATKTLPAGPIDAFVGR